MPVTVVYGVVDTDQPCYTRDGVLFQTDGREVPIPVILTVESRLVPSEGVPGQSWVSLTNVRPTSRAEADRKLEALKQAMPMKEFRARELSDDDISF